MKRQRLRRTPLDAPPRPVIYQYGIGELVYQGARLFIGADFWAEQISKLPNAPMVIADYHDQPWRYPVKLLWWDGDNDVVLVQYQAFRGTGHTGVYDGLDAEPFFDASRHDWQDGTLLDGCVFVPTCAFDWERSNVKPTVIMRYTSGNKWPTAPMICNLAQYRINARVIGKTLGVTRQAVHLGLKKLPDTIRELTAVLNREDTLGECKHEGCKRPTKSPRALYCFHHNGTASEEERADGQIVRYNRENPAPRPFRPRPKRKRYEVNVLQAIDIDEFLPSNPFAFSDLVDQRSQEEYGKAGDGVPDPGSTGEEGTTGSAERGQAGGTARTGGDRH
jgi:hypothetical protein